MFKALRNGLAGALALALSAGAAPAAEPEKAAVSIGVGSSILNYAPLPLAQTLGHFTQEGLDITVENFQAGGSKALQALVGGSVDAVVGFYDHTIQMQAQGKEIVGVFLLTDVPGVVFDLRADLAGTVKEGRDLKGLKLGITAPGSSSDMILRYYLNRHGLGARDVSILAVGTGAPGMVALESRTVDALITFDPIATVLDRKGSARPLFDTRNQEGAQAAFGGPYPTACLYTTRAFLEKNPETVQRMANAFLRTLRWMAAAPPDAIVDALPAASKVEDASLNIEVVKASKPMFSATGLFDAEAVRTPLAVLSSYDEKIAKAPIDLARTYTNRFAEEAAKRVP